MRFFLFACYALLAGQFFNSIGSAAPLPVVLWHGMGDTCCAEGGMGTVKKLIEDELGVYVYSIATGVTNSKDAWSSYIGNVNEQVDKVCKELKAIPELEGGYNGIGFSQGGQFMRAVVERCQHKGPRMHKLLTMGAQHQGVMTIPGCWNSNYSNDATGFCRTVQLILSKGLYIPFVRHNVVQAQYFKDPYAMPQYLRLNEFLADVNNERALKKSQYKANLASLDQLVLFKFAEDDVVVPRESSWFGFFDGGKLQNMTETELYKEDWIGLKALHEDGKVVLAEAPGRHMKLVLDWFMDNVVRKYLAVDESELVKEVW